MSHAFLDKFLVDLRSPIIFGDVSSTAAAAVWGGISKSSSGVVGPKSPIGTNPTTPPSGPVDPNHPADPPQPTDPGTPVQPVPVDTDPNTSPEVSRKITLTYEYAASDAPPGTTYRVTVEAWARGDPSTGTREIRTFGQVNGQEVVVTLTETLDETGSHVTGWHVEGLEVADGTNIEVSLDAKTSEVGPVDPLSGERPEGTASDFTSTLSGTVNGGAASGAVPSGGGWGVTDAGNGPSGQGSEPSDAGGPGGVVPGDATPTPNPNDPGVATDIMEVGMYFRFGYPRPPKVYGGDGGGTIIYESITNWPVPGNNRYTWGSIPTGGYDDEGNPTYTLGWTWTPEFSVGGMIYVWWVIGGPHDPSTPGYTPIDIGIIDVGGPAVLDESNPTDLSGNLKDGTLTGDSGKPTNDPFDPTPIAPSVTEPQNVPAKPVDPPNQIAADYLPMEEYPMTKDIVIHSSVSLDAPTESTSPSEDAEEVLLDFTGFSFVSGAGATFEETVRFKYLPLHARVENQPAGDHGFYTAVVGPFTGARFRELVEQIGAKVELFWDGPNQPFILFRKMPTRVNPIGSSTVVFQDDVSSEYSRDVTVNWGLRLPVPFGLGYKYDGTSRPASILKRRMMSPNEPHMEDAVDIDHYDFGALEPMSWEFEKLFKSVLSGGKAVVWRADVSHEISFE